MINGKCKLCEKENVALMESHIIPEFAYKPVYDSKHRYIDFSEDPKTGVKFAQKGVRENLLCNDCELLLSKYESVLHDFILDFNINRKYISKNDGIYFFINKINYDSVKIAILSIIYRLSVSKLPEYDGYQLGSYEKTIKDIIENNIHLDSETFSIHISPIISNGIYYPDLIMTYEKPTKYRRIYTVLCFVMYGLLFDVMVSKVDKNDKWHLCSLKENGEILFQDIELSNVNIN